MLSLVQLENPAYGRRIAIVEGDSLELLDSFCSIYDLANAATQRIVPLEQLACELRSNETLEYDPIYRLEGDWRLLPAFDHPAEPARCLVSGTGLTHKASVDNRHAMHSGGEKPAPTDSSRMYEWGLAGGRPEPGVVGVQPEWFYKGNGCVLTAHGQPLRIPDYAGDGGEEPEIAGVYIIDQAGKPRRVGFATANEFSDHQLERRNYLYLAPSKLRSCSLGPELILGAVFDSVHGTVSIERDGSVVWSRRIQTGETHMCHSLANLEHHHFKYACHRRPADAHVHFFGADAFSFGAGISLQQGDGMVVEWQNFGRALRNPVEVEKGPERYWPVEAV